MQTFSTSIMSSTTQVCGCVDKYCAKFLKAGEADSGSPSST